ncbi:hypothetical protein [Pannus brasiliensis]|uniref:hypothetical protein n=1 Tax=Pannus brasiliensis TaxID=1579216 RepID=UPI002FCDC637
MIDLLAIRQPETGELLIVYCLSHVDPLEFFKTFLDRYSIEPAALTACLGEVQRTRLNDGTKITRIVL